MTRAGGKPALKRALHAAASERLLDIELMDVGLDVERLDIGALEHHH